MAQRIVEMVIGRLIADEAFRDRFLAEPEQVLGALYESGFELSRTEIAALVKTDPAIWKRAADAMDPRLQKVSLETDVQ